MTGKINQDFPLIFLLRSLNFCMIMDSRYTMHLALHLLTMTGRGGFADTFIAFFWSTGNKGIPFNSSIESNTDLLIPADTKQDII
eukprot:UN00677